MGAHMLAIKDMAGLCKPAAAHVLVKALKEEIESNSLSHARHERIFRASVLSAPSGVDVADWPSAS